MVKIACIIFICLFLSCKHHGEAGPRAFTIHAKQINDDYTIDIRLPQGFSEEKKYHIAYVADGSIGLGQYVLGKDSSWMADLPSDCIIVSIGHTGNWEEKRRRDFIQAEIGGYHTENFGQAEKFYAFLKSEVIPAIDQKFKNQKSRVFIGHSFSGLFCLFAALKNEGLFSQYFAISPSVWANDEALLKIEEDYSKSNSDLDARINIYAGGLEIFNKVLSSSKEFYKNIQSRNYKSLRVSFDVIRNANHFSIRKPAVDRSLNSLGK